MKKKIQYETDAERKQIIDQNSSYTLIEEQNLIEGNYLVFSDNPSEDIKKVVYVFVSEEELTLLKKSNDQLRDELKATQGAVDFLLMGGM